MRTTRPFLSFLEMPGKEAFLNYLETICMISLKPKRLFQKGNWSFELYQIISLPVYSELLSWCSTRCKMLLLRACTANRFAYRYPSVASVAADTMQQAMGVLYFSGDADIAGNAQHGFSAHDPCRLLLLIYCRSRTVETAFVEVNNSTTVPYTGSS